MIKCTQPPDAGSRSLGEEVTPVGEQRNLVGEKRKVYSGLNPMFQQPVNDEELCTNVDDGHDDRSTCNRFKKIINSE